MRYYITLILNLSNSRGLEKSKTNDYNKQKISIHAYRLIKYSLNKLQYKSFQYQNIALPLRKNIIMARLMILIINVNNEDYLCLTDTLKGQKGSFYFRPTKK